MPGDLMNHLLTFVSRAVLGIVFGCSLLFSQVNLIANGSFSSDSGWNGLGLYNSGDAQGSVEDHAYLIKIDKPGTELWSVQLTQSNIHLQSGTAYVLTFDISSSFNRTIEVTVSRNGGDWVSYSGKDTVAVSPTRTSYKKMFIMKQESDSDARIEFNCGKDSGTIALRNVSLVEFTEKVLEIDNPLAGEKVHAGEPYPITWTAINIPGDLSVQLSTDDGSSWKTVGTVPADSGSYSWLPGSPYSAWCRIRLLGSDSPSVSSVNRGAFEVVPVSELLRNGSFQDADRYWDLGVHSGQVEKKITSYGGYQLGVNEHGSDDWNIQLTQTNVVLVNGRTYRYSFLAFSDSSSHVDVNIGMSHDPYTSYVDTVSRRVTLTPTPTRYSFVFTMNAPTDSNARFEVNCGTASGILFFDDFSLIPEYVASTDEIPGYKSLRNNASVRSDRLRIVVCGTSRCGYPGTGEAVRLFDLQGRMRYVHRKDMGVSGETLSAARLPFGIYIMKEQR